MVRFCVRDRFRVSVGFNSFRDFFSVLLHAQHYSMLAVRHRNHRDKINQMTYKLTLPY